MIPLLLLPFAHADPQLPIAVEAIAFGSSGTTRSGELVRRLEGALAAARTEVVFRPGSYFDTTVGEAPLHLGAHVQEPHCLFRDEDTVSCTVDVEYELFHEPTQTVVYRARVEGRAAAHEVEEATARAILDTARTLGSRARFRALLAPSAYPPALPPEAIRPCPDPDATRARIEVAGYDAWLLDDAGHALVVGMSEPTVRARVAAGPWLTATRLSAGEKVGVYQLPARGGGGCVGDTTAVGDSTVAQWMSTAGATRTPLPAPPTPVFEALDDAARALARSQGRTPPWTGGDDADDGTDAGGTADDVDDGDDADDGGADDEHHADPFSTDAPDAALEAAQRQAAGRAVGLAAGMAGLSLLLLALVML